MFYILTDDADVDDTGYSPWTDELLLVVCQCTAELHDEVYVFDNGEWEKDGNLYTAIKSSHWDDIILDPAMIRSLVDDVQGFFRNKTIYQRYAVLWKCGIISTGPLTAARR